MQRKLMLCSLITLAPALLLTGCGMDQMSSVSPNVKSPAIVGQTFGGQQPVAGATIEVVEMGTSGYGSAGTVLAQTTTDINGNFSFTSGAYTCPQSDTPVYLMGIGGNAGAGGVNPSAVLAASLGTCSNAKQSVVVLNEVTTAGIAFALSHFFTTTYGGSPGTADWFGGPSSAGSGGTAYSKGLVMANTYTIPAIIQTSSGSAIQGGSNYTVEWQKINTIANILAACVNTTGSTSSTETKTPCGKLFNYTANGMATRPSDTLQAAVQMALHPTINVTQLNNLITAQAPFIGLSGAPNDWSIGVSYTTSGLGLGVDTQTTSTLDIDSTGRVWFPSNAAGLQGAAYFDPTSQSFNGPFNSTGMVHSQQVAIDSTGVAWFNDSANSALGGYMTTSPSTATSVSLPGTVTTSVTVGADDRVNAGVTNGTVFEESELNAARSGYSLISGVSFPFQVTSVADDTTNGTAVAITNLTTTQMRSYYVTAAGAASDIANTNDDAGQVIYTGNDNISVRSYAGTGNANDGLCIFSRSACSAIKGGTQNAVQGIAIDGGKNLWIAEAGDGGILQVPVNNPAGTDGGVYLNSTGANNVPANELLHGANNGGTATVPYGIGVDASGNVWVTNAGCAVNDCTPGAFTLTEIIGAGYPTITPVSAQITSGNLVGTEPTN